MSRADHSYVIRELLAGFLSNAKGKRALMLRGEVSETEAQLTSIVSPMSDTKWTKKLPLEFLLQKHVP